MCDPRTRKELLAATEARLGKIAAEVTRRTKRPMSADEIGVKVGKLINRYKVCKHFALTIKDGLLSLERNEASIAREKKRTKKTGDGWPVHSLRTLLTELGTRCKNTCRAGEGKSAIRFEQLTELSPFQQHVFELMKIKP